MGMAKRDCRKLGHIVLTELRKRAVQQVLDGMSPEKVVEAYGICRATIYNWIALYREGGWKALDARKRGGRKPKLSGRMVAWVYKTVVDKDPRQYKLPFALWTRAIVAELIRRKYGIRLSRNSVGRLLARLGITPQKPLWRAYQQDPDRVRAWLRKEYPAIKMRAAAEKAEIWFGDEAGIRSDYHAGSTWGLRGKTPLVKTTGARHRLNMLSAVNRRGKMRFMLHTNGLSAAVFARFLKRLMVKNPRQVYLIVDGHPIHKSRLVGKVVESYKGRLKLFHLPPYSPELNPDELVWRNVKGEVGRSGISGPDDLKKKTLGALRGLAKTPGIVRDFFRETAAAYAA